MIAPQEYFLGLSDDNPQGAQRFVCTGDFPTERNTLCISEEGKFPVRPEGSALGVQTRIKQGRERIHE
jgi:hypothetical protein